LILTAVNNWRPIYEEEMKLKIQVVEKWVLII